MVVITRKIDGIVRHITLTDKEIYDARNEWELQQVLQNLESEIIVKGKKMPHPADLRNMAERICLMLSSEELYEAYDEEEYNLIAEEISKLK